LREYEPLVLRNAHFGITHKNVSADGIISCLSVRVVSLLAANSPCGDTNKPSMKSLLHIFPVQVLDCFIFHTNVYTVFVLLQVGYQISLKENISRNKKQRKPEFPYMSEASNEETLYEKKPILTS
jgi:hypothetical protein